MFIGMIGMFVLWLLVPAALIWLGVDRTRTSSVDPTTTALRILEERFAKGEIDVEELQAKRLTIQGS